MTAWPSGYGLARFDELDSTNDEARRLAVAGQIQPTWIIAARQTAGRGRRGRAWEACTGNLAATLLLRPSKSAEQFAQLSFAAALAVADMAAHFAHGAAVTLKWPNDVLAEGKKIAGILLEAGSDEGAWLAIGIGVNLACHPAGTEFPATSFPELGIAAPSTDDALTRLAASFADWHDGWLANGFSPLRDAWLARAGGLGGRIRARLPQEERLGVFKGIDTEGALLLDEGHGRVRAITAGEVFFG